jgi:predicted acylesterase/phospholipase RssA
MGADKVLAVSLRSHWQNTDGPRHIFDVIGQCFSIAQDVNCTQARACADLVIEPDVTGYRYDDFERSAALVKIGEEATRAAVPTIRKWLEVERAKHPMPAAAMNPSLEPFSPK